MSIRETFEQAVAKMQAHDLDGYAQFLADDMAFVGPAPEPLGKQAYLGTLQTMLNAFPDLEYHYRVIDVDGDVLRYASHFNGTHTGELDLSTWGMGIIPPTGKSFNTPEEEGEVTIKDSKAVRILIHSRADGGMQGMLQQLGVQPE